MIFIGTVLGLFLGALAEWVYVQWVLWALHATGYVEPSATWGHSFTIMLPLFTISVLPIFLKSLTD